MNDARRSVGRDAAVLLFHFLLKLPEGEPQPYPGDETEPIAGLLNRANAVLSSLFCDRREFRTSFDVIIRSPPNRPQRTRKPLVRAVYPNTVCEAGIAWDNSSPLRTQYATV
jgi:hypothetical protein